MKMLYIKYEVKTRSLDAFKKIHKTLSVFQPLADFDAAEKPFEQGFQILEIFASRIQPKFREISVLLVSSTNSNSEL